MNYKLKKRLLALLPLWHYMIAKPFKQVLDSGITFELYYCVLILSWIRRDVTMSEFAEFTKMQKQQVTKTINKLEEVGLVERVSDPNNKRTTLIHLTENAYKYIEEFSKENTECFDDLFNNFSDNDKERFYDALSKLIEILAKQPVCAEIKQTNENNS